MVVDCLMLTLDRYELTRKTFEHNRKSLEGKGHEVRYWVGDQGSKDPRIREFMRSQKGVNLVEFDRNIGVARGFNHLCEMSMKFGPPDVVAFLGNDIEICPKTLEEAVRYISAVPRCGIVGVDWGHGGMPPLSEKNGIIAHYLTEQLDKVFGTWFVPRAVIDELGLFCPEFEFYGLEDSDLNNRVNLSGFTSLYLPNTAFKSAHGGVGEHDSGEYRDMKNKALERNVVVFASLQEQYKNGRSLKMPLDSYWP